MAVMGVVLYLFVGTVEKGYVLASDVYKSFIAIGDLILQMAFDFVILFLVSTGIDVYLKKFMRDPSERTLRDHFRTTLGFVSVSVFLLVSAVCFFMISIHTLAAERDRLNGEIDEVQKVYDEVKDYLDEEQIWDEYFSEMKDIQNSIDDLSDEVKNRYDNMELTDDSKIDSEKQQILDRLNELKKKAEETEAFSLDCIVFRDHRDMRT
jgi:hypothetical protein